MAKCMSCQDLEKEINECSCDPAPARIRSTPDPLPLVIEKGIAIPSRPSKWEFFAQMEIGDSMFVPGAKHGHLSHYITRLRKQGRKMVQRSERGGTRVWRVE